MNKWLHTWYDASRSRATREIPKKKIVTIGTKFNVGRDRVMV